MQRIWLTMAAVLSVLTIYSQGQFYAKVNRDTVYLGNNLTYTITIENMDGDFEAPDLSEVPVVSGPNTSMSMSVINGRSTQSSSYSYIIRPSEAGIILIPPAYLNSQDSTYETLPFSIVILDNPDGLIQEDDNGHDFRSLFDLDYPFEPVRPRQEKATKPKRKIKKI